jgi:exodeoxyribonuclease-3
MQVRPLSFVSWNVDGLARMLPTLPGKRQGRRGPNTFGPLVAAHQALGSPDVLCLQEVRIRQSDAVAIASMQRALPGYLCSHSLCKDAVNGRFRGGRTYGVATYVREDLEPQWHAAPSWDLEGRVQAFELPSLNVMVASVYGVNGTDKPYFDHALSRFEGDRYSFKLRFQRLLLEHLSALRSQGARLILLGDWNVSRTELDVHPRLRTEPPHAAARAMLNDRLMPELDVVDVFRELHPEARKYTWFNRVAAKYGRLDAARVDYALISRSLLPDVVAADVPQEQDARAGSDHAPVQLRLQSRTK